MMSWSMMAAEWLDVEAVGSCEKVLVCPRCTPSHPCDTIPLLTVIVCACLRHKGSEACGWIESAVSIIGGQIARFSCLSPWMKAMAE